MRLRVGIDLYVWLTCKPYASHVYPLAGNPGQVLEVEPIGPVKMGRPRARVQVPAQPGVYSVTIDLVQEGVTWFSGQSVPMAGVTLTAQ